MGSLLSPSMPSFLSPSAPPSFPPGAPPPPVHRRVPKVRHHRPVFRKLLRSGFAFRAEQPRPPGFVIGNEKGQSSCVGECAQTVGESTTRRRVYANSQRTQHVGEYTQTVREHNTYLCPPKAWWFSPPCTARSASASETRARTRRRRLIGGNRKPQKRRLTGTPQLGYLFRAACQARLRRYNSPWRGTPVPPATACRPTGLAAPG